MLLSVPECTGWASSVVQAVRSRRRQMTKSSGNELRPAGGQQTHLKHVRVSVGLPRTISLEICGLFRLLVQDNINVTVEHTVVLEFYLRLGGEIFSFVDRSRQQHQSKKVQLRPHPNGHQNVILCFLGCALGLFLPVNQRNTEAYLHKKIPRC